MGFEPMTSSMPWKRASRAAPRAHVKMIITDCIQSNKKSAELADLEWNHEVACPLRDELFLSCYAQDASVLTWSEAQKVLD
jgi:hypothetical protein